MVTSACKANLPCVCVLCCSFEWLHWPQSSIPFTDEELQYIEELDVDKDEAMLRAELPNLRSSCLRVMRLATGLFYAYVACLRSLLFALCLCLIWCIS